MIGKLGDAAVPEWRVALLPITDIGTDRHAALNFADHRYDASRLGWTPDELRKLCIAEDIASSIDPKQVSAVVGLNILSTAITNRYFELNPPASKEELLKYMGYGIFDYPRTDPDRLRNYKSRPLHGIWATPPFLHNGSVRTIYQMISPREERDATWWSGTREYDPADLGFPRPAGAGRGEVRHQRDRQRQHRPRVPRRLPGERRDRPVPRARASGGRSSST